MHCDLSSSCHSTALAIAPGAPTPQHRFTDPQKLAAGFQLAFSRTGPKTVSCSPLPVVRFGGEHNVLSLHTHHRFARDCTCRPAVAIIVILVTSLVQSGRSVVALRSPSARARARGRPTCQERYRFPIHVPVLYSVGQLMIDEAVCVHSARRPQIHIVIA